MIATGQKLVREWVEEEAAVNFTRRASQLTQHDGLEAFRTIYGKRGPKEGTETPEAWQSARQLHRPYKV